MSADGASREPPAEFVDVLIVGAGLSGVDAAYRLQTECPDLRYAILEARDRIGGTWDLFRYPGVRSDSDMHTLGFPFRPWRGEASIADGGAIRDYIEDSAREFGIDRHIRFGHRVTAADWCSRSARWTVEVAVDGATRRIACSFLYLGSGYYDYARGHTPDFEGIDSYHGTLLQPQFWPGDFDPAGKRIVVIGSGATAVTLVPALAARGAHPIMLQRSPTYIVSRPARDRVARGLYHILPERLASKLVRGKYILSGIVTYRLSRRRPQKVRDAILKRARKALGPEIDVDTHFTPRYDPWDQRVCLVPDGDLFAALRAGEAEIVTGTIARFTGTGVALASGDTIDADAVVLATGLEMRLLGGTRLSVDGAPVSPGERLVYRGMMLDGVPNLALAFGYVNASWTLKCDLTARAVCRLLNHMRRKRFDYCVPRADKAGAERTPMLGFTSGYVTRAADRLPKQGARPPWRVRQNYLGDLMAFKFARVRDGTMAFGRRATTPAEVM